MRRPLTTALLTLGLVLATLTVASPAAAHGYISSPPSRQALCAQGVVKNCGDIQWEPQSVESTKGQTKCSGNVARFAQLDDESKGWPATPVGSTVTFNWVLTARHATSTWQYFIGSSKVAEINDGGRQPGATVSHTVNLGGFSGRQRVLAVWNVADTVNAFYACVDLQIGGGGNPNPTPTATRTPTPGPTTGGPTPTPSRTTSPPSSGTWAAGTSYAAGAVVTYNGVGYRCRQAHTAIAGWEPPNVPALWATA